MLRKSKGGKRSAEDEALSKEEKMNITQKRKDFRLGRENIASLERCPHALLFVWLLLMAFQVVVWLAPLL